MTAPFTERFYRRENWSLDSWHLPDRGRTLTGNSYPADFSQSGNSTCGHQFITIHFQELIL